VNRNTIIKISVALLVAAILFVFNAIPHSIDSTLSSLFNRISGERQPDSSIIIIHISSEDIEHLGPWPIKRSYYALLINNLTTYGVKKIGVEVFLTAKFASQAIYDNILHKEIIKANNVILSSLAGSLNESKNIFITDSLSFPSPKLIDENISTGHINFIRNYGIEIPLEIKNQFINEEAFSLKLFGRDQDFPADIKINFLSPWQKFINYSLVEFFQLVQSEDPVLKSFKAKTVLVGISDPQLSSTFVSDFDEQLPGVALHAFALDNLMNKRYLNNHYYLISAIIFTLTCLIILLLLKDRTQFIKDFSIIVLFFLVLFYLLNRYLYLEFAYSFILLPLVFVLITNVVLRLKEKRNELTGYFNEAELLKNLLADKEKELLSLQNELNISSTQSSDQLLEKIKDLKNNIEKLKENEDDKIIADTTPELNGVNFLGLVYKSNQIKSIVELIQKAAPTDATILITGESGTGKELVAQAIHSLSKRSTEKFVAVNCAALTESLLESELFGHVKGAFTGAMSDKAGKFESANKGTIFLDEIGETSENFQVKLLRVLQLGEYDKVGSVTTSITDVRVISATNKELKQLVNEKKFREDLYYRLNVINIHLPTLRERKEDIEPITRYFLQSDEKKYQISLSALKALNEYDWQGNVRELESVIRRAKVFCDASGRDLIQLNDLPDELIKSIKLSFEDLVIESLRNKNFSHSSINETAKELGNVNRTLVAENFRGLSLKILVENNFDELKTIGIIANNNDDEVSARVKSKLDTWLSNIRKDVELSRSNIWDEVKSKLNSKYKNLPQKYHAYLDEVIKNILSSKN
jgi:transcriptional regulator with GAF, ATPase, and Fis domain/CHASE2 domain-containing sensor protein